MVDRGEVSKGDLDFKFHNKFVAGKISQQLYFPKENTVEGKLVQENLVQEQSIEEKLVIENPSEVKSLVEKYMEEKYRQAIFLVENSYEENRIKKKSLKENNLQENSYNTDNDIDQQKSIIKPAKIRLPGIL